MSAAVGGRDMVPRSRWEIAEAEVAQLRAEMARRDARAVEVVTAYRAAVAELIEAARDYLNHPHDAEGVNLAARDRLRAALASPAPSVSPAVEGGLRELVNLLRQREPDNGEDHTDHDKGYEQASAEIADMLEKILATTEQAQETSWLYRGQEIDKNMAIVYNLLTDGVIRRLAALAGKEGAA